uniref:Uncharacterized protein n=1 Tax=Anguilla anguilla TaxID=7936 RepID=A0A0E9SN50_ANGAN
MLRVLVDGVCVCV